MICGCGLSVDAVILICMSLAAGFAVSIDQRVYLLFCVTQMWPRHMKAKKPVTMLPYIDFWTIAAYPYASLPQIVPTEIYNF